MQDLLVFLPPDGCPQPSCLAFLPAHLLRLGRETVLTPNFTSLLAAFCEDQSVVLIRDNHLLRHMLGDYSMSGTRSDHGDTVEGKWFSYPIPVGCK